MPERHSVVLTGEGIGVSSGAGGGIQDYESEKAFAFRSIIWTRHSGVLSGGGGIQVCYPEEEAFRSIIHRGSRGYQVSCLLAQGVIHEAVAAGIISAEEALRRNAERNKPCKMLLE